MIELLVVVAIIALLISILLPSLNRAREQARRTVCATHVRGFYQTMVTYSVDNRDYYPDAGNFSGMWDETRIRLPEYIEAADSYLTADNTVPQANSNIQAAHPAMRESLHLDYQLVRNYFYCPSNPDINDDKHWFEAQPYRSRGGSVVLGYMFLVGRPEFARTYAEVRLSQNQPFPKVGADPTAGFIQPIAGFEDKQGFKNNLFPVKSSETTAYKEAVMDFTRAWGAEADFQDLDDGRKSNHIKSRFALERPGVSGKNFMPNDDPRGGANIGYTDGSVTWKSQSQLGQLSVGRAKYPGYRMLAIGSGVNGSKFWW